MTVVTLGGRKMSLMCNWLTTLRASSTSWSGMTWVTLLSTTSAILYPRVHVASTRYQVCAQHEQAQLSSNKHAIHSAHSRKYNCALLRRFSASCVIGWHSSFDSS